jgi:preprotein translocase subunit SecA
MARKILENWSVPELSAALYPERHDRLGSKLDRWLGRGLGRAGLWVSPLRRLALRSFAAQVHQAAVRFADAPDEALRRSIEELRPRLLRQGLTRGNVADCFALVCEVSSRTLGLRHYPVQVMGGYQLLRGGLAEMATGEGKTLAATLPAVTVALAGLPVHIVTVNEYLAARDARTLAPLYGFFGLRVGWTEPGQKTDARREAYACDITYCVNKDLVFDYLRDRLNLAAGENAARRALRRFLDGHEGQRRDFLRGLYFAIVDEADSIFVDEARTPLIISGERQETEGAGPWRAALRVASALTPDCYALIERERAVILTPAGRRAAERASAGMDGQWRYRKAREELVQQALAAQHLYQRDKHYIIVDGKIQIVDEFTGRTMEDRSWERGLHQLIECKEDLEPSKRRDTIARITYQRFFRRYLCLAGMTGTGAEVAPELRSVFGLATVRIPTHRPMVRRSLGERVFTSGAARWDAVIERIAAMRAAGRATLVGTRSVEASEHLSSLLQRAGIEHALLNARQDAEEAAVIAAAGRPGQVTVATNMAGRGTDIGLDPEVRAAGGLHVILTEFHESRRIDRQLFGRAGRQGDPGSHESLVSLDDDLFAAHAQFAAARLRARFSHAAELPAWFGVMLRVAAQASAERLHARIRTRTLESEKYIDRSLAFSGRGE